MIESITLKNITNINEAQIDLSSKINILIGDNGSGKSNIIKAFKFLNNLTKMEVKDAMNDVYGHIEYERYWALNREKPTELELEFDQGLKYYLKIEGKNEPIITEERVTQCGDLVYESEGEASVLALNNGLSNSGIEYVKENIRDMEFYVKGFDKEATAKILNRLLVSEKRNEVLNVLRIAGIDDVEIRNNQGKLDLFVIERGGRILTWKMLSSGVAKYIGLVAVLMNPSRSKLIFLENPDAFIHQDMIMDVAQLIFNKPEGSKIVLTTHSPYFLDVMQDCIDYILVLNRETDSTTTLEKIGMDSLDEWLDKYSLGELWEKGQLGGNKW